jgi:hypothetical protein
MRTRWQTFRSVVVWSLATLAGIAVCWWGVRPVLDAAVPDRLVAFPAAGASLPVAPPPPPRPAGPPSASPSAAHPPAASRLPRASSSGTTSASPTATVVDGWTRFPDGHYTRTFQLVGGSATLSAEDGVVELLSATPNPAYVMTVSPTGDDRVVVNFTGLNLHVSTLDARWDGSAPTAKVTEIP